MLSVKLSQTAEYALRAMSTLALIPDKSVMTAVKLSTHTNIPQHYLSKIMKILVNAKLAQSIKGHGGGFRITKPLKEIRFIDILSACGWGHEPDKCVLGDIRCNAKNPCILHNAWANLNERFKNWAQYKTLQQIRNEAKKSGKLLLNV